VRLVGYLKKDLCTSSRKMDGQ